MVPELPLAMQRDEDRDDEANPDKAIAANPQRGSVSMLSMAASMTEGLVPEAVVAANYNQFRARDLHDEFNFTRGGTLESYFREALDGVPEDGKVKDDDDNLSLYADMVADERAEKQRELEAWQHDTHSYAGLEMSGAEWQQFATDLSEGGKLRQWLVDDIQKREHKTKTEAQTEADRIALLAKMQSMPKDQWTDEMKALDNDLNAHPDERTKYEGYLERSSERRDKGFAQADEVEQQATNASDEASSATRVDYLTAKPFAATERITPEYNAAAQAKPQSSAAPARPEPEQLAFAKAPPASAASGGFDV